MTVVLAIQSLEREHFGFLLTHFDGESVGDCVCEGDCVFQILPTKAKLLDSPLAHTLFSYHFKESGEHRIKLTKRAGEYLYEITPASQAPVRIELSASGQGQMFQHPNLSEPIALIVATAKEA